MKNQITNESGILFKTVKLCLGILFVVFLVIVMGNLLFFVTSDQAFINTRLVTMRSPITGSVHFSPINIGGVLTKGQEVFTVSNPRFGNMESNTQYNTLQNLIDTVKNEVSQSALLIQRAEIEYTRYKSLNKVGGVSKDSVEKIENDLEVLKEINNNKKEQLAHLLQRYEEMGQQLDLQKKSNEVAPCSGAVWSILSKEGEQVQTGDELVQIVNPDEVWVDAFFSEKFAAILRPGMQVTVSVVGGHKKWEGEIVFIRSGSGRVLFNTVVEMPPVALSKRMISVRIKVHWNNSFKASEFYGVGRSMVVIYPRFFNCRQ